MNQDWEKVGKDILNIVNDAVNSQNFSEMNKSIANAIQQTVGNIQKGMRSAKEAADQAAGIRKSSFSSAVQEILESDTERKKEKECENLPADWRRRDLFQKKTSVKAGGLVLTICGCVLNSGLGLAVVILLLVSLFLGQVPLGIKIALSILLPFLAGSAVVTWKGSSMLSALKRYRNYIKSLQGRTYCNIRDLAAQSGKSASYVVKDVQKMIEKGWFRQGHLNDDNTCLMVSHETYREYESLQRQRAEQQREQEEFQKSSAVLKTDEDHEKLQKIIGAGEEYIRKIRTCSQTVTGREISNKISHMEMLVQKIFDRVEEDPASLEDINKLMEYYLPTTVKLLEAYQQLCSQPVQGENIRSSKMEIEQTLDTLNEAFEKLLDSLFEDVAWDVSSDISVLHTMLAQEGLVEDSAFKTQHL
ncbi:MAG: hypothetical protein HFI70_02675 [Lachnospiraceae bacterium]|nr:hypothetical protein [Lachnospiraceae bacterium]